jgi:hypothetical protein
MTVTWSYESASTLAVNSPAKLPPSTTARTPPRLLMAINSLLDDVNRLDKCTRQEPAQSYPGVFHRLVIVGVWPSSSFTEGATTDP